MFVNYQSVKSNYQKRLTSFNSVKLSCSIAYENQRQRQLQAMWETNKKKKKKT